MKQRFFRSRALDTLPLTIEHQRIYILPTRCGIAYLASLLLMLIASINYSLNLGYALSFLLTGLFAASLLHTYKNLSGLGVKRIETGETFAGDAANFDITLDNTSDLARFGIQLKTRYGHTSLDVDSNSTHCAQLQKPTTSRGYTAIERVTLTSSYPLGLWRTWCYVHPNCQALVYPAPEINPPALPTNALNQEGDKAKVHASGDISGLRDYQAGDSQSAIAWKVVARGQGVFVKTFEDELAGDDLLLNLSSTGLFELEERLSRLCAWVLQADNNNLNFKLELNSTSHHGSSQTGDVTISHSNAHSTLKEALDELATYRLAS